MMMMIMMMMMMMMMMIAFKGANRDFGQSPHCATNCLKHVSSSGPNRVQLAVLRATWYEGTAQLLGLTELNRIDLSFTLLAEPFHQ